MKLPIYLGVSLAALSLATFAVGAEFKSGLTGGEFVPAFDVVKCAGAVNDGVERGSQLCYR